MSQSLTAYWAQPTATDLDNGGERHIVGESDVDELFAAISKPLSEEAVIYHNARPLMANPFTPGAADIPDHEMSAAARGDWGYLRIWTSDDDGRWILDGAPESPAFIQGDSDFPAGSGLPLARVVSAVKEFLSTARQPTIAVRWRPDAGENM